MNLEQSITYLENFRQQLKPGLEVDEALERVLFEVKKNRNRHQFNQQANQQKK